MKFAKTFALLICLSCLACDNDDDTSPQYDIPTTYIFENVNYSGQTQRLAMFTELKTYMATSRETGTVLDFNRLQAMYTNDVDNAAWQGAYETSKQLRNKTLENVQADFDALLEELALASQSTVNGSEGQSGVISSEDGTKSYLIGDDGLDHAQLIEKGLMGACLYYQATSVYFGADKMNVDNETIEAGEGTMMEHHWDEAFGYFGVPTDFPTNTAGLLFWGNYSNKRNSILNSNEQLMDELLKGRAAISNNDLEARDEAIAAAREQWELIAVGSAIHYLNEGMSDFEDMALRGHGLSEAIGFIYSIQFNEAKIITNAQVDELLAIIAGDSDFSNMNLYTTSIDNLQSAKDKLVAYYELENLKDEL